MALQLRPSGAGRLIVENPQRKELQLAEGTREE
jgi:hypothetical protein